LMLVICNIFSELKPSFEAFYMTMVLRNILGFKFRF
jgi:hypothetical protein